MQAQDEIEIEISTFDHELISQYGTAKVLLSGEQISDIISHAIQFTIMNSFVDMEMSKDRVMEELYDALQKSGLLDNYLHLLQL